MTCQISSIYQIMFRHMLERRDIVYLLISPEKLWDFCQCFLIQQKQWLKKDISAETWKQAKARFLVNYEQRKDKIADIRKWARTCVLDWVHQLPAKICKEEDSFMYLTQADQEAAREFLISELQ